MKRAEKLVASHLAKAGTEDNRGKIAFVSRSNENIDNTGDRVNMVSLPTRSETVDINDSDGVSVQTHALDPVRAIEPDDSIHELSSTAPEIPTPLKLSYILSNITAEDDKGREDGSLDSPPDIEASAKEPGDEIRSLLDVSYSPLIRKWNRRLSLPSGLHRIPWEATDSMNWSNMHAPVRDYPLAEMSDISSDDATRLNRDSDPPSVIKATQSPIQLQ